MVDFRPLNIKTPLDLANEKSVILSQERSKHNYTLEKLANIEHNVDALRKLLFRDRTQKDVNQDVKVFWETLKEFKEKQKSENFDYDFSYIIFPSDKDGVLLNEHAYDCDVDFSYCIFNNSVNFSDVKFKGKTNFQHVTFKGNANFSYTSFKNNADFSNVTFKGDTYFSMANFQTTITFENSECKNTFDFSDVSFESLLLDKSNFPHASYLRLYGWNSEIHEDIAGERLSAKHFQTKESARIIKAHFEKQNNIIESNIYYPIEMDKYREELTKYYNPFIVFVTHQNYFVTTLSKYISNYNTSWLRVLFWILFLSLITLFFHDGLPSDKTTLFNILNRAMELINPLNIFKKDYNLYKDHEFWAMLIRIITIYLFYQFAVAFRHNTRRK